MCLGHIYLLVWPRNSFTVCSIFCVCLCVSLCVSLCVCLSMRGCSGKVCVLVNTGMMECADLAYLIGVLPAPLLNPEHVASPSNIHDCLLSTTGQHYAEPRTDPSDETRTRAGTAIRTVTESIYTQSCTGSNLDIPRNARKI